MKNKNLIIWILAIISTISTTALVTMWLIHPAPPQCGPDKMNRQHCDSYKGCESKIMKSLNLDSSQKTLFLQENEFHHKRVEPVFDSLRLLRTQLFDEVEKENPDSVLIKDCIEKISEQEQILQTEGISHIMAMKKFLAPVQIDSLISIYSRAMMPMGKGMHKDKRPHCSEK